MNACSEYIELISASIDEEISDADRAALEAHLAVCPECRRVQEAFSTLHDCFPTGEAPVPAGFTEGTMYKIKLEGQRPTGWKKFVRGYGRYTGIAAVLVVVMLGAWAMRGHFAFGGSSADCAAPGANSAMGSVLYRAESDMVTYSATTGSAVIGGADAPTSILVADDADAGEAQEQKPKATRAPAEAGTPAAGSSNSSAGPVENAEPEAAPDGGSFEYPASDKLVTLDEFYSQYEYRNRFYSISYCSDPSDALLALLEGEDVTCTAITPGERHYRLPAEQLSELEAEGVFYEIIFDDLTAEYGLIVVVSE